MPVDDLLTLVDKARANDDTACKQLIDLYYPQVKAYVGHKMDQQLRSKMDSTDIVQSVVTNFWIRLIAGEFDFTDESSVIAMLMKIAKDRLIDKRRGIHTKKRDVSKEVEGLDLNAIDVAGCTPSVIFAKQELVGQLYSLMTKDERLICEMRFEGAGWAKIGQQLDKSPDAIRKQYKRAIQSVVDQMGLNPDSVDW